MIALLQIPAPLDRILSAVSSAIAAFDATAFFENFRGLAMSGDPVLVGVLVLLTLCALGIVWSLLMIVTKAVASLFGGGKREPAISTKPSTAFAGGLDGAVPAHARLDGAREPMRLDNSPVESRALMTAPRAEPLAPSSGSSSLAEAVGGAPRPSSAGGFGFDGARALPAPSGRRALPFRQIALQHKPRLADIGKSVEAPPEWTGKVTPTSLREAGAVELGHIVTRGTSANEGASARERDFTLFSLPRVDKDGRTQLDLMVVNVADHGILPRGVQWPPPKGAKRD